METWRGIYPITSFVLDALKTKRAADPASALSGSERVLLECSEFWAAAAHGTLEQYLQSDPGARLRQAQQAFTTLGAVRVASLLRVAAEALERHGPAAGAIGEVISQLDERLARTDDNVDALIARFASGLDEFTVSAAAQ